MKPLTWTVLLKMKANELKEAEESPGRMSVETGSMDAPVGGWSGDQMGNWR